MNTENVVSPYPELDKAMTRLHENKKKWVQLPLSKKIQYLENLRTKFSQIFDDWTKASLRNKGVDPDLPENKGLLAGEYANGIMLGNLINLQLDVLKESKDLGNGKIELPKPKLEENKHVGRQYVRMAPRYKVDALLFPGFSVDVWMDKEKPVTQGKSLEEYPDGSVCVILGGGNVFVLPALDAIHKLFTENQVVMVKYNPVNASTGFWTDKLMSELHEDGFYEGYGGETEPAAYLVNHKYAETLHMTGSEATYDRIVWGRPNEWSERKLTGNTCNSRHFTCELGCVSPWLLTPGKWDAKSLRVHAKQLAKAMTMNNGFICASPKVAVVAEGWEHKAEYLKLLQEELEKIPTFNGYYKGAHFRHQTFIEKYKDQAILIKPKNFKDDHLAWVIVPNLEPVEGEYFFRNESFSPFITFVELKGSKTPEEFLRNAPKFCNEKIWGTLSCTLIVPEQEAKQHEELVEKSIDELQYGTVGYNIWAPISFAKVGVWGGYPGTGKKEDIQSGIDFVANPYMFDNPVKTVGRCNFVCQANDQIEMKNQHLIMYRVAQFSIFPTTFYFSKILSAIITGL